jgi:carboxyl-terminal processing protease
MSDSWKRASLLAFFILGSFVMGSAWVLVYNAPNRYAILCEKVYQHFYRRDEALEKFKIDCLNRSSYLKFYHSAKQIEIDIKNSFSILDSSHLEIKSPTETKAVWYGEVVVTGIEANYFDEYLIVTEVMSGSIAAEKGIRPGDIIESLNGELTNPEEVAKGSGEFALVRGKEKIVVALAARKANWLEEPRIKKVNEQQVYIRVDNFHPDYLEDKVISKLKFEISKSQKIILDLRKNSGGEVSTALRFLALFVEPSIRIARLEKVPRSSKVRHLPWQIGIETEIHKLGPDIGFNLFPLPLDIGESNASNTKDVSTSSSQKISVLIGPQTASMAEVVALVLREQRKALLVGLPTAGKVLVAKWFELPELGRDYFLTIPIYDFSMSQRIEGKGIVPDRVVVNSAKGAMQGADETFDSTVSN